MATKLQILKRKLINNYVMPKEVKARIIEQNFRILIKVSIVLSFLCFLTLLPILSSPNSRGAETSDYIFYYTGMTISYLTSLILSLCSKKIKILRKSNAVLFLNFISIEFVSYWIFTYGVNPFSALVIFVCLATLHPLVFTIEPLYYSPLIILFGILIGPKFAELYGSNSATNGFIYLLVMSGLSMNRWFYIKRNIVYENKTKEREKQIQQELNMAALVQKSFYQHDLSNVKEWEIAYYNDPMLNVSGDLFDFFVRREKLDGLCIFDVSGHGLASGLVTMLVKNTMEEEFYENEGLELDFTMQKINERVSVEKGNIENYLSGIIIRLTNNAVEIVNAGHPSPIVYNSATNTCDYLNHNIEDIQGAIGIKDLDYEFKTQQLNPDPKDRIILYTDGVTEAKNILNEEYGKDRFLASVQKHSNLDVRAQMEAIVKDVMQFIGTTQRNDDISIIIMEKK